MAVVRSFNQTKRSPGGAGVISARGGGAEFRACGRGDRQADAVVFGEGFDLDEVVISGESAGPRCLDRAVERVTLEDVGYGAMESAGRDDLGVGFQRRSCQSAGYTRTTVNRRSSDTTRAAPGCRQRDDFFSTVSRSPPSSADAPASSFGLPGAFSGSRVLTVDVAARDARFDGIAMVRFGLAANVPWPPLPVASPSLAPFAFGGALVGNASSSAPAHLHPKISRGHPPPGPSPAPGPFFDRGRPLPALAIRSFSSTLRK